MQLCKGAGSAELAGMHEIESRHSYLLARPFLEVTREEIVNFLDAHALQWFHDESNDDLNYTRNYFRHEVASKLLHEYSAGIKQSFKYLDEDVKELIKEADVHHADEMSLFVSTGHRRSDIFHIDKTLKSKGYILTASQRDELKRQDEIIAGRKFVVILDKGIYYIAPYLQTVMDKEFKEECRKLGVPVKLRPYLSFSPIAFILFTRFLPCNIDMHGKG
jgi:tRNA(Ile)-lysidine synthase